MASSVPGAEYQVFLSFRGPDTRQGFTDCLYHSLVDAGVRVFRDNEEIRPGEKIEEILRAIDSSVVCIPIFSKGYASSKWCLRELAEMVEKKKRIMPVFYDVTPDDVKLRTHLYRDAMGRYENENGKGQWEKALKEVVEISGWEPSDGKEEKALKEAVKVIGWEVKHIGHAQLCKLIVKDVLANLKVKERIVTEHLVGMFEHVETLLKYLDLQALGVRYVGIHGIGGSGKTTLAKAIFNQLSAQFEGCSFLADVRESSKRGLVSLQRKMIHDLLPKDSTPISDTDDGIKILKERCRAKKVLIVLDDVYEREQIDALAGNPNWFSFRSRIIVTTRDVRVFGVEPDQLEAGSGKKSMGLWTLEMKEMDLEHALQLFSKHAFKMRYPPDDFLNLSKQVISAIGRLPLALEVIGSHLCGKPREAWEDSRTMLLRIPRKNIQQTLLISYQALEYRTKQIFLDIACFPVDMQMDYAIYMWRSCGLIPEIGIRELISTSLIKVSDDKGKRLWMHDHLRDLGKELVCMENFMDVGKRSRLWDHEEALGILKRKEGTGRVELLHLSGDVPPQGCILTNEHFRKLRNVRFIRLDGISIIGDFEHQLTKLRWLSWHSCPVDFVASNLQMEKLAVLDLSRSNIDENWKGWGQMKVGDNLTVLNLTSCPKISRTPDFSQFRNLERLTLDYCEGLRQIDSSIGNLKSLKHLSLKRCRRLQGLPEEVGCLERLEELFLSYGIKIFTSLPDYLASVRADGGGGITRVPSTIGMLGKLKHLTISTCPLKRLPGTLGDIQTLVELNLCSTEIDNLPDSIGCLKKLERLNLRYCEKIRQLPSSTGDLQSLSELDISFTGLLELPDSIGNLVELRTLKMRRCLVRTLPRSIGRMKKLEKLDAHGSALQGEIPTEIGRLSRLRKLNLSCTGLSELPDSVENLEELRTLSIAGSRVRTLPRSLGKLKNLERLDASASDLQGEIPTEIGRLSCLRALYLSDTQICLLPSTMSQLSSLESLWLERCHKLEELPRLPKSLISLRFVSALLKRWDILSNQRSLTDLILDNGYIDRELYTFPGNRIEFNWMQEDNGYIDRDETFIPPREQTSLSLCISNITTLPSWLLGIVSQLESLILGCPALEQIPQLPSSLSTLVLMHLHEGMELPCLSNLQSLSSLMLSACSIGEDGFRRLGVGELAQLERLVLKKLAGSRLGDLRVPGSLKIFHLNNCTNIGKLPDLLCLKILQELAIVNCEALSELPDLGGLESLQNLVIHQCGSLKSLGPHLPVSLKLKLLQISSCRHLMKLPELSRLKNLKVMEIKECEELVAMPGLGELESLEDLVISTCTSLERLWLSYQLSIRSNRLIISEYLPRLPNLRKLAISGCDALDHISGLGNLPSLQTLEIAKCNSLRTIGPDPLPASLEYLRISSYTGIEFGDVSHLKNLRYLWIGEGIWVGEVPGLEELKLTMGEKGAAVRQYRNQDNFLDAVCIDEQPDISDLAFLARN